MTQPILEIRDLQTEFSTYEGTIPAVNGVSLSVKPGETLGIVGETGAGKSVTIYSILNQVPRPGRISGGEVMFGGRDLVKLPEGELRKIRGKDISLIVPNPRSQLNPILRVGIQVANVILAHRKTTRQQATEEALQLLRRMGIPDPERRLLAYPHELSGGMCQRVIIAMALANSPQLILADEPTSGLDVTIQIQILDLFRDLVRNSGSGSIVVTRDLGIVAHYCDRIAVMYAGRIVEEAETATFFKHAVHPYSRALINAAYAAQGNQRRVTMTGQPFNHFDRISGCALHPRCPVAQSGLCESAPPELETVQPDHLVRCHRKGEIAVGSLIIGS